jgi:hypothetical protein
MDERMRGGGKVGAQQGWPPGLIERRGRLRGESSFLHRAVVGVTVSGQISDVATQTGGVGVEKKAGGSAGFWGRADLERRGGEGGGNLGVDERQPSAAHCETCR